MEGIDEVECGGDEREGFVRVGGVREAEGENEVFFALFGGLRRGGTRSRLVGYLEDVIII